MAVVTGGGTVDALMCCLSMHTGLVDLDRVFEQNFVLPDYVDILVTLAAGVGEVRRMSLDCRTDDGRTSWLP